MHLSIFNTRNAIPGEATWEVRLENLHSLNRGFTKQICYVCTPVVQHIHSFDPPLTKLLESSLR